MRMIDYYNKHITEDGFSDALDLYLYYMETNKLTPEFTKEDWDNSDFDDIEETTLSHVIYHAELNGFVIDDYMI